MKEAYLYKKIVEKKAQCLNCAHYCFLDDKEKGKCGVRQNIEGKIFSLVYGKLCALHIDPIEKKPLFHFLPKTKSLSVASVGCSFACQNCQNWQISQTPKITGEIKGEDVPPKVIVETAKTGGLPSISYTYTDPIIFSEYALDIMKLAKKQGIKNVWVTSGFFSKELFDLVSPFLDAVNVDLKYFSDEDYKKYSDGRLQPILDTLKRIKEKGIWIEITTLVIPTISDKKETLEGIARFIKKDLGAKTPWHVTRFCAKLSWKLQHLPDTPIKTLEMAWDIGKKQNLKYVYIGNLPRIDGENTYCPKCNALSIERHGYLIKRYDKNGKCPQCNESLSLILE